MKKFLFLMAIISLLNQSAIQAMQGKGDSSNVDGLQSIRIESTQPPYSRVRRQIERRLREAFADDFMGVDLEEVSVEPELAGPRPIDQEEVRHHRRIVMGCPVTLRVDGVFLEKACGVCMQEYLELGRDEVDVVPLSCGHVFCKECVERLAQERNWNCPICRQPVRSPCVTVNHSDLTGVKEKLDEAVALEVEENEIQGRVVAIPGVVAALRNLAEEAPVSRVSRCIRSIETCLGGVVLLIFCIPFFVFIGFAFGVVCTVPIYLILLILKIVAKAV